MTLEVTESYKIFLLKAFCILTMFQCFLSSSMLAKVHLRGILAFGQVRLEEECFLPDLSSRASV